MSRPIAGSFAARFPTAARLLGMAHDEAEAENDGAGPGEDDEEGDEGDETATGDEGGEGEQGGDAPADEGNDGEEASAITGVLSASGPTDAQIVAAFEQDAARLVAAERDRCMAVFTSDAGRRNPTGAATLLGDPDMNGVSSATIIKFLGTSVGSDRAAARSALRGDANTRVETGAGTDAAAGATDAKAAHRKRQEDRNKRVKGAKKRVGATSIETE